MSEELITFEEHISPLFRPKDIRAMSGWFDLSKFDDVRRHSDMILKRVADQSMPCDCPWSSEKVQLFQKWIEQGMHRSSREKQENNLAEPAKVSIPSTLPVLAQSFEERLLQLRVCSNEPEVFYNMMNLDFHLDFIPTALRYAEEFFQRTEEFQKLSDLPDLYRYFEYSYQSFSSRLDAIYSKLVADADSYSAAQDPDFTTRDRVLYLLTQKAPFHQTDGSWLRHALPTGPMDEVHSLLFRIYTEEVSAGMNHPNVYTEFLKTLSVEFPPVYSRAYAEHEQFHDGAFTLPVFQLVVSQFSQRFLPELLGMTLYLEWTTIMCKSYVKLLKRFDISPHFYTMHIGVDNVNDGHGRLAKLAVQTHLDMTLNTAGAEAVQLQWKRIWNGFTAFGLLGDALAVLVRKHVSKPPTIEERMIGMITHKAQYGSKSHGTKQCGCRKLNDWFGRPKEFLSALQDSVWIVPGEPDRSSFITKLTSPVGPMFKVFSDEELALWREWISHLPQSSNETDTNKCKPKHHH